MRINSFLEKPHFAQSFFQLMSVVAVSKKVSNMGLKFPAGKIALLTFSLVDVVV